MPTAFAFFIPRTASAKRWHGGGEAERGQVRGPCVSLIHRPLTRLAFAIAPARHPLPRGERESARVALQCFSDAIVKQPALEFGRAPSPLFFAARGRRTSSCPLAPFICANWVNPKRAGEGSGAPKGAAVYVVPRSVAGARAPLGAPPRRFSAPGRASCAGPWRASFPRPAGPSAVSELLAAGRNARGRSPGAARERGYEPRPQAPHPTPPSFASHENALGDREDK